MRVCSRLAVDEEVVGLAVAHDGEDDDGGHDGEHPAHLREGSPIYHGESFINSCGGHDGEHPARLREGSPISHKRSLFEFRLNSDCERV